MKTSGDILAAWRLWQESQSLSNRTITERAHVIEHLLRYTGAKPLKISPEQIIQFTSRQDISAASRATYHASIRAYCVWLVRTGRRRTDPSMQTPRPKRPKGQPRPVPNASLALLLARTNRRRTRMMILLAALAGLRVHEIAKLRGEDVDLLNGILTVTGKGGKTAMIPLHEKIAAEASNFPRRGWWFPAYEAEGRTGHIQPGAVSAAIIRTMTRAGVPGRAHQLRHWYATSLIEEDVNLRIVQSLMRHETPATTAIYTQVNWRQQLDGISRLHLPQAA